MYTDTHIGVYTHIHPFLNEIMTNMNPVFILLPYYNFLFVLSNFLNSDFELTKFYKSNHYN